MRIFILLLSLVTLAGCFSIQKLSPTQADAERMSDKYPGYTLAELEHGQALYVQHCGNCHTHKNPKKFTEAQWQEIVPDMAKKVNKKEQKLDAEGEEAILRFVVAMSSAK